MIPILLTPPEAEPVALADVKNFLRVGHDADDTLIGALIASARLTVEAVANRLLVTQTWRIILDSWPASGIVETGLSPLRGIGAARLIDADGEAGELDVEDFAVEPGMNASAIRVAARPEPGSPRNGIEIDVIVGYGEAVDVPDTLRHAVRLLAADWYERRGAAIGAEPPVPAQVARLIAPYRRVRL